MINRVFPHLAAAADLGVFATAISFFGVQVLGFDYASISAIGAGCGAFIVGVARGTKYFAEARKVRAEAARLEEQLLPEYFDDLEQRQCWNAPDCPTREIYKPRLD